MVGLEAERPGGRLQGNLGRTPCDMDPETEEVDRLERKSYARTARIW